ncbi:hypothetical protein P7K49_000499 [Saguinus oedipus]|uniref:Uncharacterized protein n=1 Tax=Saguinus oedipus TaxID=9490 RepID=A0ABQ9WBT4_SAGOE|nr:hypothetical protein P7K49_000499 [Saguinus oedipus]
MDVAARPVTVLHTLLQKDPRLTSFQTYIKKTREVVCYACSHRLADLPPLTESQETTQSDPYKLDFGLKPEHSYVYKLLIP